MKTTCFILLLIIACVFSDHGNDHSHDSEDCHDVWNKIKLSVDSEGHATEKEREGSRKMTYCEYYREAGMCEVKNKHFNIMLEYCMKTCGYCEE